VAVARSLIQKTPSCFAFSASSSSASPNNAASGMSGTESPAGAISSSPNTFPVFPVEYWDKRHELSSLLPDSYDHFKLIHVVRHAQGTHNVNKNYRDEINLDARLTELGRTQCEKLAQQESHLSVDLVVTSPLTRCVQTALYSFPQHVIASSSSSRNVPFVAHESLRETVNFKCDQRRTISEIASEFGEMVDFSVCHVDEDYIWKDYEARLGSDYDDHRESAELHVVAERGRRFFQWLQGRPEQRVVVCTHSAFLRCLKSWGHPGGVPMQVTQSLTDPQLLQDKDVMHKLHPPVVQYHRRGDSDEHEKFERWMRSDYENAEMRSFVVAFPSTTRTPA
jgi:broad specificity phosphatase PhoE